MFSKWMHKMRELVNKGNNMSFQMRGTQTLTTKRLILRRFEPGDAEAMFRNWVNDPRVAVFMSWEPHGHINSTQTILSGWIRQYNYPDNFNWAIVYQGEPVGAISAHTIDTYLRAAELGYCLGYDFWGQGIMTEAVEVVIDYLFSLGFNRIAARHHPDNPASGKVMQKAGMTYEGLIRQGGVNAKMGIYDLEQYAIVASDRNR
jgi:RimJ/RimL family protein N-acetyltransferase